MRLFDHRQQILEARATIEQARSGLKDIYSGIDGVVDRVCDLSMPWLAIPDSVTRPIIVCQWGMTGTGKTSLVRVLFQRFLRRPLIQMDLGTFTNNKDFSMEFYRHFADFSGTHCGILLDEIQNPRTINEDGHECDREGLRGLWSLLSDGIIVPDVNLEKDECIVILERVMSYYDSIGGAIPKKKRKKKVVETSEPIDSDDDEDDEDDDGCPYELSYNHREHRWELTAWTVERVLLACNKRGLSIRRKIESQLHTKFRETLAEMLSWLYDIDVQPVLDFSKTLIFITGNLDEVYTAAHDTNPDITADELHERSKRVTVPDVKQSLLKRFRAEQVARLGNNHILYPCLKESDFRRIIQHDLGRVHRYHSDTFDVDFEFDQTVEGLIYAEGVFPTQGARPVLATTSSLVDGTVPSCLVSIIESCGEVIPDRCRVKVSMDSDPGIVTFHEVMSGGDMRLLNRVPISLAIESLRKPVYDDNHVSIAIHEAGHAVLEVSIAGTVPVKVCAFSPDSVSKGYTDIGHEEDDRRITKDDLRRDMVLCLAGWAAERVLLGDGMLTPGSKGDIDTCTEIATDWFKKIGFGTDPIAIDRASSQNEETATMTERDEANIRILVSEASEESLKHVRNQARAILDLSTVLLCHSSVNGDQVLEVCERNGVELAELPSRMDAFEEALAEYGIEWEPPSKPGE